MRRKWITISVFTMTIWAVAAVPSLAQDPAPPIANELGSSLAQDPAPPIANELGSSLAQDPAPPVANESATSVADGEDELPDFWWVCGVLPAPAVC